MKTAWHAVLLALPGVLIVSALYYLIRTASNRTTDSDSMSSISVNPLNAVGYSQYLTPRGRVYRQRFIIVVAALVLSVILAQYVG
jgi:hypothetical protein